MRWWVILFLPLDVLVLTSLPVSSILSAFLSSLFDAEASEPRSVLHILDLANQGFRLPAAPRDAKVRGEGGREAELRPTQVKCRKGNMMMEVKRGSRLQAILLIESNFFF